MFLYKLNDLHLALDTSFDWSIDIGIKWNGSIHRVIVPSQPQQPNSSSTFNSDLYILNTQDYTWINYFDASNIYSPDNSLSLGAKIGIYIAVVVALVVMMIAGFFIYKKFHVRNNYRNSVPTSGTSHIVY
ncbi:12244_t:CDS:2 [Cetraspora pellucida]|uniref:12244_t:CDS:1 n=1 Tax=Cetraspora pellucida TaxID=1433469 RepID=A0A9N8WAY5_9GLOM|nr:12244_t:CDS:2 [Cetraspora pellucida]